MDRKISPKELHPDTRFSEFAPVYKIDPHTVVKTGQSVRMAEAETMRFVREHTTIPVPTVHSAYRDSENTGNVVIVMEFIEGENLDKAWAGYGEEEQAAVIAQLSDYMAQLRSFKGTFIGSIDGTACNDQFFYDTPEGYGPFKTEEEFNNGIARAMSNERPENFVTLRCDVWKDAMHSHDIVLTHNDLDPRNIIVQGSKIAAIIDWELAGYYPEYWEYCKAISGPDWEHPWSTSRVVEKIMKPYRQEVAVFWAASEILNF